MGPINLLIIGVGGQGVVTLCTTIRKLCEQHDIRTHGAILKGGAQRLGTVRATLRIFDEPQDDYYNFSTDIPEGQLDLLLALEPWEGLRAYRQCSATTAILLNTERVPLMIERTAPVKIVDPVEEMRSLGLSVEARDYSADAVSTFGSKKMLNYLMGRDAIKRYLSAFAVEEYDKVFRTIVGGLHEQNT